jgi:uncharacterized protein YbgA (DUF1722 family)/uncharacterized protein YbbK (DUF523 family)
MSQPIIQLGISSCLLGKQVRWDGGDKLDPLFTEQLGRFVRYYPVCPEVESGFGVPREPLRLMGDPRAPRLITERTGEDQTGRMLGWARRRVRELERADLDGFILKGRSPSCGMKGVRVYGAEQGAGPARGPGLFARVLMKHLPLVPVEDDNRLHDPLVRASFIERVCVMQRWREGRGRSRGWLVQFHTAHKLLILSHSPRHCRIMGELVARAKALPLPILCDEYRQLLTEALNLKATPAKHANVLQHIMGYFKKELSADAQRELLEVITAYRQGHVPLIVPINLINHYVRRYDKPYLQQQYYLHPHPLKP